jgi:hypothetical protein
MTDNIHLDGHDEEEFEREDLGAKPIIVFLIALIIGCVLVAILLKGMYSFLDKRETQRQPAQSPLVEQTTTDTRTVEPGDITKFPQPRLETHETVEINAFRLQEAQTLNSYGWVDQQAGVVRIPIDRAMELVVERGLPTQPPAGVVPSSDVNTGKAAAQRSDTSAKPAKKK